VRDEILKTICKKGLDFIRSIKNSRNIKNEYGREFLFFAETIANGLEIRDKQTGINPFFSLLKTLLEICALEHNVAPSMLATSKDLEKLMEGDKKVKCLSGWRYDIFGAKSELLIDGKITLGISSKQNCIVI